MRTTTYLILLFFLLPVLSFSQTNYYVSPSGDNSNNGTSLAQAWQTIQHAMNNATANSIVNITAGTYNEKVEVNVSGTAGNMITFQNYNDDVVTVSGAGISGIDAIIGIFDHSYIIIKGLNIANNEQLDAQGIIVEGDCQNIEIRNNDISNIHFSTNPTDTASAIRNSQPLIVYGSNASSPISNLIIDGNTVHDSRTGYSEGLAVNGNVDGFEVTNNIVRDITNIGIDLIGHEGTATSNDQARNGLVKNNIVYDCKSPYATAAGIYVDGAKDIIIENNTIYQCQWGIEVGCENVGKTTSGIEVRNNIIYSNDDAGLVIGGFDFPTGSGKVIDCLFTNNSCYNNDANNGGIGEVSGELNITYTENCTLENNIFYTNNSADLLLYVENVGSINLGLNYNQFYIIGDVEFEYAGTVYTSFASYQNGTSQDANSIFSDPQFEDISTPDLHLTNASPGIDFGNPSFTPAAGETDMDGESRVENSIVDIGADELSIPLPVEFSTPFQAILNGDHVVLKWETASERNSDKYIIQRSTNAFDWTDILTIEGQGNSITSNHYKVLDSSPLSGLSYYRLIQIDLDETMEYSNAVTVSYQAATNEVSVYPNPVSERLSIEFYNPLHSIYYIEISNASGRMVEKIEASDQKLAIDVSHWPQGIYFIKVSGLENNDNIKRILVSH